MPETSQKRKTPRRGIYLLPNLLTTGALFAGFYSIVAAIDESLSVEWHGNPEARANIAAGAFQRVLTNLVSNALQHGEDARVVVRVGLQTAVHVIDRGPGIPEEARDKVFQPFYRLERSRSRTTGGSGLGLAIVHQLCQAHGWRVSIEGSPEGGTDACVRFATAPVAAVPRAARAQVTN